MTIESKIVRGARGAAIQVTYWRDDEAGAAFERLLALAREEFGVGVPVDITGGTPNDKGFIDPAYLMATHAKGRR